jgi:hypothetical protein
MPKTILRSDEPARDLALVEDEVGRVLINVQIGAPLSGARRKAFAHSEPFSFWTQSGLWRRCSAGCGL